MAEDALTLLLLMASFFHPAAAIPPMKPLMPNKIHETVDTIDPYRANLFSMKFWRKAWKKPATKPVMTAYPGL